MSDLAASYDAIPYPSRTVRQSHPDRLHVIAKLCGLSPPSPDGCRVLELGCASGGNLIPMAAGLPESTFRGVDLSATQADRANATIEALGLTNIEVVQGDLRALEDSGEYDYVIAHGLLSWVDRATQPALFALIRARLAPQGVGYVSYNALPGWKTRGLLRDMMLFHVGPITDPRRRVEQARHMLDYLAGLLPGAGTPYEAVLQEEMARVHEAGDAYLAHDHLELHNEPLYLHEVVGLAREAGLRYIGDSTRVDLSRTLLPERGLARDSDAFVRLLQYEDFAANRVFRSSLFVRDDVEPTTEPDPTALGPWWIEPLGAPGEDPRSVWPGLDPAAVGRLRSLLGTGDGIAAADVPGDLLPAALAAYLVQEVELWPRRLPLTCQVSDRPRASAVARLQADRGEEVIANQRHEPVPVDNFDRRLLIRLDGTRDLAALNEALVASVASGELEVTRQDGGAVDPSDLVEVFRQALPLRLLALAARGLLAS